MPSFIDKFDEEDKFYYIMQRQDGECLTDAIKKLDVTPFHYDNILHLMAKIHVLMPAENFKPYDFDNKAKEKIIQAELNERLYDSLGPVIDVLINSNHWGFNNDSITDNWGIKEREVILYDTENRGVIPYAVDLATFLNFIPHGDIGDRLRRVDSYIKYVNDICDESDDPDIKNKKITETDQFMKEYCNGVVYRSVANYGYLFSKPRIEDSKAVVKTGIEMVDHMLDVGMVEEKDKGCYLDIKKRLTSRV